MEILHNITFINFLKLSLFTQSKDSSSIFLIFKQKRSTFNNLFLEHLSISLRILNHVLQMKYNILELFFVFLRGAQVIFDFFPQNKITIFMRYFMTFTSSRITDERISSFAFRTFAKKNRLIAFATCGQSHQIYQLLMANNFVLLQQSNIIMEMIPEDELLFNGPLTNHQPQPELQQRPIDEDQNLVVATKGTSRVKGFNIKKIFEEVSKQQQSITRAPPLIIPPPEELSKKQSNLKKNLSINQKDKKKTDGNVFGKILQQGISNSNSLLDIYKFSHSNKFMIDQTEKARAEFKEKIVLYLLYGIQQLKLDQTKLNQLEKNLIQKSPNQIVEYVKNIANEIQLYIIRHHNKLQKSKLQRGYKDRANLILVNIRDESNNQLRNKILNKKMTAEMLSTVRETDLYTSAKRQELLAKSRSIMAQNTLQIRNNAEQKQMVIETIQDNKQSEQTGQSNQSRSKYVDQKIATEVMQLINKHVQGFYVKLKTDLPSQQAGFLCSHLDIVFPTR